MKSKLNILSKLVNGVMMPGDYIKVRFNSERFWCEILEIDGDKVKTRVANDCINNPYKVDDILHLELSKTEIITYQAKNGDL